MPSNDSGFIRAIPSVKIEEFYRYNAHVKETSITTPVLMDADTPHFYGQITLEIPYYSTRNGIGFNHEAQKDFYYLEHKGLINKDIYSTIGFLGIEKPEISAINDDPLDQVEKDLQLRYGIRPIEIPVGEYQQHRDKHQKYVMTLPYKIGSPPDKLDVRLEAKLESEYDPKRDSFNEFQILTIEVKVKSEQHYFWTIKYMYLDWPLELSWAVLPFEHEEDRYLEYVFSTLDFSVDADNRTPTINYEKSRIEWDESNTTCWRKGGSTFIIPLIITEPCRMADVTSVTGRVLLQPHSKHEEPLLSGLKAHFFDATGWEVTASKKLSLEKETTVILDFEMDIQGLFKKRDYLPRRSLIFNNTIPEKNRYFDIRSALLDAGLQPQAVTQLHDVNQEEEAFRRLFLLEDRDRLSELRESEVDSQPIWAGYKATKKLGGAEAIVCIIAKGQRSMVERRIDLAGGGYTTSKINSGRMDIWIRAQHDDSKYLNELLNVYQSLLKERLERFKVM